MKISFKSKKGLIIEKTIRFVTNSKQSPPRETLNKDIILPGIYDPFEQKM